jgi:hypothetical protein
MAKCKDVKNKEQCRWLLDEKSPACFEKCRGVSQGKNGEWPSHECKPYEKTRIK